MGASRNLADLGSDVSETGVRLYLNPTTISSNYTIPTNYNAGNFGPITVATGVTVTVPDGSTWTVV